MAVGTYRWVQNKYRQLFLCWGINLEYRLQFSRLATLIPNTGCSFRAPPTLIQNTGYRWAAPVALIMPTVFPADPSTHPPPNHPPPHTPLHPAATSKPFLAPALPLRPPMKNTLFAYAPVRGNLLKMQSPKSRNRAPVRGNRQKMSSPKRRNRAPVRGESTKMSSPKGRNRAPLRGGY